MTALTSSSVSPRTRAFAAVIAAVAWIALALQVYATMQRTDGLIVPALWVMSRYFTIFTNLVLAATLTAQALGRRFTAGWLGGVMLSMLLVGIVYALLLGGMFVFSPVGLVADILLHKVGPVLAALYWLFAAPKGLLRRRDPWLWSIYPLGYFVYALVRGGLDGHYPYPFMNPLKIGWPTVLATSAVIAVCFIAAGFALVWLDGRLARRRAA